MSVTSGFYNSVNNDRKYNAEQLSSMFDGIINDGIFMAIGDKLIVSASNGMNVVVGSGRAWFNRTWTNNDAPIILTVDSSEIILNRIDVVVLEVNADNAVRTNTIRIIKGTPSSIPVAPALSATELVHQYPLAHIYVGAGVTEIIAANITNKIGTAECPFITGIMETVNIDALLSQWDGEFNTWFATIQSVLDENTAGNLLNLINANTDADNAHKAEDATTTVKGHVQLGTIAGTALEGIHAGDLVTDADGAHGLKIEYGNFTPTLTDTAGNNAAGITATGYYEEIDKVIHTHINLVATGVGGMVSGNGIKIGGLSHTAQSAGNALVLEVGAYQRITFPANYSKAVARVIGNYIQLLRVGSNVDAQGILVSELTFPFTISIAGTFKSI
jgi:hypothetical protein